VKLILLLQFLLLSTTCISQAIRDVKATQRGNTIVINYDFGPLYETGQYDVSIFCSTTGGKTWQPMNNVSGDVGERVEGGLNKQIIWDVLQDRASLIGDQITFEIRARRLSTISNVPSAYTSPAIDKVPGQRNVSGTITDENGDVLIGASVLIKGTSQGTVSDLDGQYSLTVPEGNQVLVFSYVGYETQEAEVGALQKVDIVLMPGILDLGKSFSLGASSGIRYTPIGLNLSVSRSIFRNFYVDTEAELRSNFNNNWITNVDMKFPYIVDLLPSAILSTKRVVMEERTVRSFSTDVTVSYYLNRPFYWLNYIKFQGGLGYNTFFIDTSDMDSIEQKNFEIPLGVSVPTVVLFEALFRYRPSSGFHDLQLLVSRYMGLRGLTIGVGYEKITNTPYEDFLIQFNYSF
jgi:hypothetical protein